MPADPLQDLLRLVAEGRLTAEEAAPILAALDERPAQSGGGAGRASRKEEAPDAGPTGFGAGFADGFGGGPGGSSGGTAESTTNYGSGSGPGASLRVEVREAGRQVVNLRLPVAVGRLALERVPGLSGEQVDSVKEALRSGMKGPILEVEDGTSSVRILVE